MNNEIEIKPVSEMEADTRRLCEIRFDCLVTMHDVAFKKYKGVLGHQQQSKTPQWFRAMHNITLEAIKYADPYDLGIQIKAMFNELQKAIEQYERPI